MSAKSLYLTDLKKAKDKIKKNRLQEAEAILLALIKKEPHCLDIHLLLANTYFLQSKLRAAAQFYQNALIMAPTHVDSLYRLGQIYRLMNDFPKAEKYLEKAIALMPESMAIKQEYFLVQRFNCSWEKLDNSVSFLEKHYKETLPFLNVMHCADPKKCYEVAKYHSEEIAQNLAKTQKKFTFSHLGKSSKIKVGIISNDFYNHPVYQLIHPLFEHYDKNKLDLTIYSHTSTFHKRYINHIKLNVDHFVDIGAMDDLSVAQKIYNDHIHILIDLKGHTAYSRLGIFALRPAPIQITYLGFPGTTGANFMDYIITDTIVTPLEHLPYYAEAPIYMPTCYQVNHRQKIADTDLKRSDVGLPENAIVFACFNGSYKITPAIFNVWMRLLKRVPESVLWLLIRNESSKKNLLACAAAQGVSADKLIFANKIEKEQHLKRLSLADLALDTFLVNGHTTTSDALLAGVPVITLEGNTFISRVSSSILQAIDLKTLVTNNLRAYEETIFYYATHAYERQQIKQHLKKVPFKYDLFNIKKFCRYFEKGLEKVWHNYLSGKESNVIYIPNVSQNVKF